LLEQMAESISLLKFTTRCSCVIAVLLAMNCMAIAQEPGPEVALTAKVEGLKEQYGKAGGERRVAAGDELIDAQMALADALVAKKDFTGAQNVMKQAVTVATTNKSEKSKAVMAKLSSVSVRKTVWAKVETLRDGLIHKPNDVEMVKQLVDLLVLEFDDVKGAQEAAAGQEDKGLKKALTLAGKKPGALSGPDAKELATWYAEAAKRNAGTTKASALSKEALLLKGALENGKIDAASKAQLQAMFDGLPAEVKAGADGQNAAAEAPAGTITPAVLASWFKNLPKEVSTGGREGGREGNSRASKIRDYVRENKIGEAGKTARFRGTLTQKVSFRKNNGKWQAELSIDIDMPADSVKMRSHLQVPVTDAQMGRMSEQQNLTVEVEGKVRDLYVYSTGGEGQGMIFGLFLSDGVLLSFK
jgi:hypothetical protein